MDDLNDAKSSSRAQEAVHVLQNSIPDPLKRPRVGVICGSGLAGLADAVSDPLLEVPYSDIPHFPKSTGIHLDSQFLPGRHIINIMQLKAMQECSSSGYLGKTDAPL